MKVIVSILHNAKESTLAELTLTSNPSVKDLINGLEYEKGLEPDDYRLCYQIGEDKFGLEEDESITKLVKENETDGTFVAEMGKMGFFNPKPKVEIQYQNDDFVGEVSILLGPCRNFEHFLMVRQSQNLKLPSKILNFDWRQNKLGVIEEETNERFVAYQYWIEDGFRLQLCRNAGNNDPKWILKRMDNGKILKGTKKSYPRINERQ